MERQVFIRLRHRLKADPDELIRLGHIAQVAGDRRFKEKLEQLPVYQVKKSDQSMVVLDVMKVIEAIHISCPDLDVQTVGSSETIVEIQYPKRNLSPVLFIAVWLLLFVGAGLAVMNFHEDVSMRDVHILLYEMVTGKINRYPYLLQIPYSIGLGLGMILFFNHLFKKRFNEEPSPLEVEMFKYQLDLDQYVAMNENKETTKDIHDH
ncbi:MULTISPECIES: stage V sporulation protein AA [Bacillus]|uniref:stage V sporulation protein AA n=1 Tax=Bacillus TaxID=1386 RepID=UPI0004079A31|nr:MULTISPECIES: stage V sporulation protein AA [Bacillus]QHZ47500.1 stage V sporulation protein AA [Bacillus sp. NSP9.1]WFA03559.1 stage V sporulation protein AA [Bacillus sp. HSf4]